jgi:hypothetical protein
MNKQLGCGFWLIVAGTCWLGIGLLIRWLVS